jgi:hypothetical protein
MLEGYQQYITDVTTGKAVVCKYVRQAVERQLRRLETTAHAGLSVLLRRGRGKPVDWVYKAAFEAHVAANGRASIFYPFRISRNFGGLVYSVGGALTAKAGALGDSGRYTSKWLRKHGKTEEAAAIAALGLHD